MVDEVKDFLTSFIVSKDHTELPGNVNVDSAGAFRCLLDFKLDFLTFIKVIDSV